MQIKMAGVILAGGQSSRMGGPDKCLLELGGKTLVQRAADRLADQVPAVSINTNSQSEAYQHLGHPVISDSFKGFWGPLAGILSGMDWASKHGANHIVTAAADTPFFPENLVNNFRKALQTQTGKIAIAQTNGEDGRFFYHPTFGLWPVELRDDLHMALQNGVRKIMHWVEPYGVAHTRFPVVPFDPFFNINRPEDFEHAQYYLTEYNL